MNKLKKQNVNAVLDILAKTYPTSSCGLYYLTPFELVLSLILAAQCTDIRVNQIRPMLSSIYPTPLALSKATQKEVFNIIRSCSFPNNKAKHIIACSKKLVEKYNGIVPSTMDELLTLPGIGRKSANIILSDCFHTPVGIAVDTHVHRLANRIGLSNKSDVKNIEIDLLKSIPKTMWKDINHRLVEHGKNICIARKPKCADCSINMYCVYYNKPKKK